MKIYAILLRLLLPWALIRLWWRSRHNPQYAHRWSERLGYGEVMAEGSLWIHAVSVGETRAAAPLIRALLHQHPEIPLLVTTTTLTGAAQVDMLFGNSVHHRFAPFDLPSAVGRFLQITQPRAAVVLETELWPTLFQALERAHIPLFIVNARLSERSYRRYRRLPSLMRATLAVPAVIAAQSFADGDRLQSLGAPKSRCHITGNMKFELSPVAGLREAAEALRHGFGERLVWVAASTHEGEESLVLDAHAKLRTQFPNLLLILVPRHPERFEAVAKLLRQRAFTIAERSHEIPVTPDIEVLLGDTMGELMLFFAAADCAFIGGSLVPTGGHNPLEACALNVPVIFGPHMFNFDEIARLTLQAGAGTQITEAADLSAAIAYYLLDPKARAAAGEAGHALVQRNQGACARTLALLEPLLGLGAGRG